MKNRSSPARHAPHLTRRSFIQSSAAGLFVLGVARDASFAQSAAQTVLSGTHFDLEIGEAPVNFTGKARIGTVVNGQVPAPLLRWREGDTVTLRVSNRLPVRSSIHWHGMIVPADMDGVPGLSFDGIPSGGAYRLSLQGESVRHLLVSLALALPGTDRAVRPDRHRAAAAASAITPIASTSCCFPIGPTSIRSGSSRRSRSRATTTTSASARSGISSTTCARRAGARRSPSAACGDRCA